jgi:hypothetical protein
MIELSSNDLDDGIQRDAHLTGSGLEQVLIRPVTGGAWLAIGPATEEATRLHLRRELLAHAENNDGVDLDEGSLQVAIYTFTPEALAALPPFEGW